MFSRPEETRVAILGLGYVGLPLAVEFGKHFDTIGYDINTARIDELRAGNDRTLEVSVAELGSASLLRYAADLRDLHDRNVFIVTVPTPINEHKQPDFSPLIEASRAIGRLLKPGSLVVYESTVYPGATEEICVPELERFSGLRFNADFYVGYSPERINPGDKGRKVTGIPKVTSGSTPEVASFVDEMYGTVIAAGTHKAPSIKVAEAAKVIENTQRDANIALMNEFALIFHRLGIDTNDVIDAASTKWNFLPFRPGLVGGHCIGIDPYYLIQKAQSVGYHPDILLACRRINDAMGQHVAAEVVKLMIKNGIPMVGAKILVLGFTFKEDCPDLRNTRVVDLVREFCEFGAAVDIYDPWASLDEAEREYGLQLLNEMPDAGTYDAVVIAVGHKEFRELPKGFLRALGNPKGSILYDVKCVLPAGEADGRL